MTSSHHDDYTTNGFDRDGYNASGFDAYGYDRTGFGPDGYDATGYDRDGFDRDGYDRNGRDRYGFDRLGRDSAGRDASGFYPDGYNDAGFDPDGYDRAGFNRYGTKTHFGDASRPELLLAAGIENTRLLVIAIDNREQALSIARFAREVNPNIDIVARAYDRLHTFDLYQAGTLGERLPGPDAKGFERALVKLLASPAV